MGWQGADDCWGKSVFMEYGALSMISIGFDMFNINV